MLRLSEYKLGLRRAAARVPVGPDKQVAGDLERRPAPSCPGVLDLSSAKHDCLGASRNQASG
eukprot:5333417-Prymnesium_polylepis.1